MPTKILKAKIYNQEGRQVGKKELNPTIFGVEIKPEVVHQVVVTQMANRRQVLAHTKGRSEVRGGGKKPWRQKGTGRARHGSIRSPIWVGGGVTFGPTKIRNFNKAINKKIKRKALFMSLSDKIDNQKIILLDKLELSKIKTKKILAVLQALNLRKVKSEEKMKKEIVAEENVRERTKGKKVENKSKIRKKKKKSVLIILPSSDEKVVRSACNLSRVETIRADSLNVYDILRHEYLLMPLEAVKKIEETYLKD